MKKNLRFFCQAELLHGITAAACLGLLGASCTEAEKPDSMGFLGRGPRLEPPVLVNLLYKCRGFLKWWVSPTTIGFPTKNDQHLGCFGGYHHLWKRPNVGD